MAATFPVEVCCAFETRYVSRIVEVTTGTSCEQAIVASGIEAEPDLPDWRQTGIGVHGQRRRAGDPVEPGDRIELQRPLVAEPKAARRERVERARDRAPDKWRRR
jgi:putative ubiquitin-RnfH superfamily antitoxin RatB of RatAB toxin-antitoxin module